MGKTFTWLAALVSITALTPPAPAQDAPTTPANPADLITEMRAMVERMRGEMFQPGERVAGWDVGGADPDADLRAAGADSHAYHVNYSGGPAVIFLTRQPISAFAPSDWRVADTYGRSAAPLANPFIQFNRMSARYVMAVRANSTRRGGVDCMDPVNNAVLYEIVDAPAGEDDDTIPLFFRISLLAGEDQMVCSRYEGSREAGYSGRSFLPDGRALPQLDDSQARIRIVPVAPVDELLAR